MSALSAVLPTMLQTIYRYDVMDTGLLMAPRGCGVMITMMLSNWPDQKVRRTA